MKPFLQIGNNQQQTTLEHWHQILTGNQLSSLAAFAYVTESGVAQLDIRLRHELVRRPCRWLFSIDYGRSHPSALRTLSHFANSNIRIYDGEYVVQAKSFVPRISYHLKTALTLAEDGYPSHQIVGSGNLSASGLLAGIEAGCLIDYAHVEQNQGASVIGALETIWEGATPLEEIINEYEEQYVEVSLPRVSAIDETAGGHVTGLFWIDVGYVTKNRGNDRPGNQFDLPRGSHVYLGLQAVQDPELNSTLGFLNIRTPLGQVVERRLRFGNNAMEKLTLPIPEDHGYQCYDGKILTFRVDEGYVVLDAFEHEDFFQIYGMYISSCSEMQSGRKYGTISLPY